MIRINGAGFTEKLLLKKVEKAVFKALDQRDIFVADVDIVSEEDIRRLNAEARKVDKVTDVLSFPSFEALKLPAEYSDFSDGDRDGNRVYLGSIVICRKRALEQAEEYGHSYKRELGFLLCHGMLHLLGFDHVKEEDEEVMLRLQKRIMDGVGLRRG